MTLFEQANHDPYVALDADMIMAPILPNYKELFKINQLWDKFVQSLTIVKSITIINTDLETNN